MSEETKTAVLGLGLMGVAVTLRLKTQGMDVVSWNRSPENARELAAQGVAKLSSAR